MREIKFRGYNTQKGWLYGMLERHILTKGYSIGNFDDAVSYNVEENSIGQYTGYIDRNKKQIYEGDIIRADDGVNYIIEFCTDTGAWVMRKDISNYVCEDTRLYMINGKCEVIGNDYEAHINS